MDSLGAIVITGVGAQGGVGGAGVVRVGVVEAVGVLGRGLVRVRSRKESQERAQKVEGSRGSPEAGVRSLARTSRRRS